ncbi:radical SAM protein [Micromonospora sp. D93]|uniref:radical SAM protein n=1 Tax=Micromonospora sp. D93 TaxID=2824886 RepID=UPI001B372A35|nr:radical SAM protein [Micromonospora sp. D93]MBQ1019192.1 radical SAM protein [Micromonospora sp. D93]
MHVPAADIYLTYRCNMRCRHCFVGPALDQGTDLPKSALISFLQTARSQWDTREISFLGGEPTLYPHVDLAIKLGLELGYHIRLVSNGGSSLLRLMRRHGAEDFDLAVSLDAATQARHDALRRPGSFRTAVESIIVGRQQGRRVSAILSVGRHNLDQALDTLLLLGSLDVDHVNVHYVTDRGFATADMLASPEEWRHLRDEIVGSPGLPDVRFEGTFRPAGRPLTCAAEQESMLMLFPDQRVYSCTMFVGLPDGNAHRWSDGALIRNEDFRQRYRLTAGPSGHCPAVSFVNETLPRSAEAADCTIGCIFDKEFITARQAGHAAALPTIDRRAQ